MTITNSAIYLRQINDANDDMMSHIHTLYHTSFPPAEQRPWQSLTSLIGTPFFKLYVAIDNATDTFAGFMSIWLLPSAVYIEHLAVVQSMRSHGVGGYLVDEALKIAGDRPLVVEVELPSCGQDAIRRIAFYERKSLSTIDDITYFQPPYAPGQPDVELLLMSSKPIEDITTFVIQLHTIVYNA